MILIRDATFDDLAVVTEIYNEAIEKTVATFDTKPKTDVEQKKWFMAHGARNPLVVAEESGVILGWASLTQWSDRCAYADTAEISLYVKEQYQGKGIGRKLIKAVLDKGKRAGLHTVIARITDGNAASVHLHEAMGFKHIGVMKEVGRKFGRLLDVHVMQLLYSDYEQ